MLITTAIELFVYIVLKVTWLKYYRTVKYDSIVLSMSNRIQRLSFRVFKFHFAIMFVAPLPVTSSVIIFLPSEVRIITNVPDLHETSRRSVTKMTLRHARGC